MVVLWLVCGQAAVAISKWLAKRGVDWIEARVIVKCTVAKERATTTVHQRLEQKPDVCPKPRFAPVLDMRQGSHCSDLRASLFDDVTVKLMLFRVCVCVYILIVLLHCGASISWRSSVISDRLNSTLQCSIMALQFSFCTSAVHSFD